MRKALGIIFYIIAGFFVYMVCLLSFINQSSVSKWGIVAGFSLPALLFLSGGLAINRFQNWRRHCGIVFLSGAGFTCFLVFTIACMLMSAEYRQMMPPGAFDAFNDYISGGVFTIGTVALGILLLITATGRSSADGGK